MVRKFIFWLGFTIIVSLLVVLPAIAGGWAVITLDGLPGEVTPAEPLEIGFMVRQHGQTPMAGLEPVVTLSNLTTGDKFSVQAEPGDEPGHYQAILNIPSEGQWNWSIQAFSMNQEMPPLNVGPTRAANQEAGRAALPLPYVASGFGVVLTLAALGILLRKRARWAYALVLAGLLISGFGFISASANSSTPAAPDNPEISLEETGRQLFLAKGCITCHNHEEVLRTRETIFVDVGPDLSKFTADPAYLSGWLKDPASIKPKTEMPNLGLSESEIEALVAFVNSD
jgi:cytochrome c2